MKNSTTKSEDYQDGKLRVVELFAGVGGFRLGLCGTKKRPLNGYSVVWANQWEPSTQKQHAADIYRACFHGGKEPNAFFNEDINKVVNLTKLPIPNHNLLVGGFPCQDYSVARTLSHAAGIEGKKGILWWAIHKILERKGTHSPEYLMLENVDRLLKSPAKQRGRDFGIILASLANLEYAVEWRVINAADYGMPQRRRRTFILAYKNNSPIYRQLVKRRSDIAWLTKDGVIAKGFPVSYKENRIRFKEELGYELTDTSDKFQYPFENTGLMVGHSFITIKTIPIQEKLNTLGSKLLAENEVLEEYFIPEKDMKRWHYLKGAKRDKRTAKNGFEYEYKEGPVAFPDSPDKPSRTIITGEGGSTPARHKHVVLTKSGRYRRLMPIELERLSMFPDRHTELPGIGDQKRAFFMGNALVVGVIEKLGRSLLKQHRDASKDFGQRT
ncbi:MAG: DNA (cytosine-5-)-methyltransferase [Candidatus Yanofskybacteria bacterium]|nr:DNA (cytosine-5-)-methyltransferase [Candidatus Yanofskybacteria bacterium]